MKYERDLPARGAVRAGCAGAGGALSERGVSSRAPFCLASLRALLTSRLRAQSLPLLSRKHVSLSAKPAAHPSQSLRAELLLICAMNIFTDIS